MNLRISLSVFGLLAGKCAVHAFTTPTHTAAFTNVALRSVIKDDISEAIEQSTNYKAGVADSDFARLFGSEAGKKRKTVGQAFADFTEKFGSPINALYKNMMSDLVGTCHLTVSDARFVRDPIWSLGIITALETLLRNYPEEGFGDRMISALLESNELDEAVIRAEAESVKSWAEGKTAADVAAALKGEGDGPVLQAGEMCRNNEYFKYSRYFGVGLTVVMSIVGVEEGDNYNTMQEWVGTCLGKPYFTACSDNDLWFKTKSRLEMMETMMKEIEIREKKKMAERLEARAEYALAKAKEEAEWQAEVEKADAAMAEVERKKEEEAKAKAEAEGQ